MEKAGDVVGLDVSFRRVIQLWNPALKNGTTRTLVLNLQCSSPAKTRCRTATSPARFGFILERPWHPLDRRRRIF